MAPGISPLRCSRSNINLQPEIIAVIAMEVKSNACTAERVRQSRWTSRSMPNSPAPDVSQAKTGRAVPVGDLRAADAAQGRPLKARKQGES